MNQDGFFGSHDDDRLLSPKLRSEYHRTGQEILLWPLYFAHGLWAIRLHFEHELSDENMRRTALTLALKAADHVITAILEHNSGSNRTSDAHGQHGQSTSSVMGTSSNTLNVEAHAERGTRSTVPTSSLVGVATTQLAKFSYCSCPSLSGWHVAITRCDIDIRDAENYAVAISYIWGEFKRKKHRIGHIASNTNLHMYMELGMEWDVNNMMSRLVEICQTGKWCWIDQVCSGQGDREICKTLEKIPVIYRTLPVIALLPGSLCKCLTTAYPDYQHAIQTPQVGYPVSTSAEDPTGGASCDFLSSPIACAVQGRWCVNSNGSCSWTGRVWPSQELRYAQSIRVVWADPEFAQCQRLSSISPRSSSCAMVPTAFLRKLGDNFGNDYCEAVRAISHKNDQFFNDLGFTLVNALEVQSINFTSRTFIYLIAEFLLGRELRIPQQATFSDSDVDGIGRVIKAATTFANTRRKTEKPKDYVLAVWPDWAGYEVPSNSKKLSEWELLDNAVQQARRIFSTQGTKAFFPSRCPSGMSSTVDSETAHWCPWQSLYSKTSKDSSDVYGLLEWRKMHFIPAHGAIPVKLLDQHTSFGESNTMTFEQWSDGQTAVSLAASFDACTQHWFGPDRNRFDVKWRIPLRNNDGTYRHDPGSTWSVLLLCRTVTAARLNMRRLICDALNFDAEACERHSVDLMFARRRVTIQQNHQVTTATEDILCVGLMNMAKLRRARMLGKRTLSVALWSIPPGIEAPFYEVAQMSSLGGSRFTVIGIWMPLDTDLKIVWGGAQAYIPYTPIGAGDPDLCLV